MSDLSAQNVNIKTNPLSDLIESEKTFVEQMAMIVRVSVVYAVHLYIADTILFYCRK